jgi:chromosome segregation ATPase
MKYPRVAGPTERVEAQVLADIEVQSEALADGQRERADLQQRRREMLASAGIEAIEAIDATISRAATKIEIAEAKIGALEGELESLRTAAHEARAAANLARALHLGEEARQLILGDYAAAALAIAKVLTRLVEIASEVRVLNSHLPPDAAEIDVEWFRGYRLTLGETVMLPSVTTNDADFWPTRPRSQRVSVNEIYARN